MHSPFPDFVAKICHITDCLLLGGQNVVEIPQFRPGVVFVLGNCERMQEIVDKAAEGIAKIGKSQSPVLRRFASIRADSTTDKIIETNFREILKKLLVLIVGQFVEIDTQE
jgi:hypothetical protein